MNNTKTPFQEQESKEKEYQLWKDAILTRLSRHFQNLDGGWNEAAIQCVKYADYFVKAAKERGYI